MPTEPVQGLKELQKKLMELGSLDGGKTLRSATLLATTPIMRTARKLIPENDRDYLVKTHTGRMVAPGFAKRSIARKAYLSRDKSRATVRVGVKSEAYYAVQFVELGTSKQPKQPWLEPASRWTRDQQINRFSEVLRKKIDQVKKRRGR